MIGVLSITGLLLPDTRAQPRLVLLDVGQGDAIYVRTPSGEDILIDTGPGFAVVNQLKKQMPSGDTHIELLILTHLDADHSGGTVNVFENFSVGTFATNGAEATTQTARAALDASSAAKETVVLQRGKRISAKGFQMDVLWPAPESESISKKNEGSVVVNLLTNEASVILTGDISEKIEAALLQEMQWVRADILKVAHHGSAGSSSVDFLRAAGASRALISAGINNRYGHPRPETIERLTQANMQVSQNNQSTALMIPL